MSKLVRDRVPDLVREAGGSVEVEPIEGAALAAALREKLVEESMEVSDATGRDQLLAELADVAEVVAALLALEGFEQTDLDAARAAKRATAGGFDLGLRSTSYSPPAGTSGPAA